MRYRLSERAKGTFELLAYMLAIGQGSERDSKGEYKFPHGKHVIYYRVEQDEIVIENIVFGPTITDLWGDD